MEHKEILNALLPYEFSTFQLGATTICDLTLLKEEIIKQHKAKVALRNPELSIIVHKDRLEIKSTSLYVKGRYRKFSRKLPQSKWPCRECGGKGCGYCKGKGKMYETSVEELLAESFLKQTQGSATKFHSSGREDVDVIMRGSGRPFVLEIENPKKRDLNLESFFISHPDVAFIDCEAASTADVTKVKSNRPAKKYRALFSLEEPLNHLKSLEKRHMIEITQKTPIRVLHRRTNKPRTRTIFSLAIKQIDDRAGEIHLVVAAGTYIKEFISGDLERTEPSLSSLLDTKTNCTKLDVLSILDEELIKKIEKHCNDENKSMFLENAFRFGFSASKDGKKEAIIYATPRPFRKTIENILSKACKQNCTQCQLYQYCLEREYNA